jgi:hypothetical protein
MTNSMRRGKRRYIKAAAKVGLAHVAVAEEFESSGDQLGPSLSFDRLVAAMQTPTSKRGVKALFKATPAELGRAAAAGARKAKRRRPG